MRTSTVSGEQRAMARMAKAKATATRVLGKGRLWQQRGQLRPQGGWRVTKGVMATKRPMATAKRVAGDEEAMATAMRVAGNNEGEGSKGNSKESGG
jgi:hypothetical protein